MTKPKPSKNAANSYDRDQKRDRGAEEEVAVPQEVIRPAGVVEEERLG